MLKILAEWIKIIRSDTFIRHIVYIQIAEFLLVKCILYICEIVSNHKKVIIIYSVKTTKSIMIYHD